MLAAVGSLLFNRDFPNAALETTSRAAKAIGMPLLPTANIIKPAAIRRLEHDPEKWEPVFGKGLS